MVLFLPLQDKINTIVTKAVTLLLLIHTIFVGVGVHAYKILLTIVIAAR